MKNLIFIALCLFSHTALADLTCSDRFSAVYLTGDFELSSTKEKIKLYVGKPKPLSGAETTAGQVFAVLENAGLQSCEADCQVLKFERYKKDKAPAKMELLCENPRLHAFKTPLTIEWKRASTDGKLLPSVSFGTEALGKETVALNTQVDRYLNVPTAVEKNTAVATNAPIITAPLSTTPSAIAKPTTTPVAKAEKKDTAPVLEKHSALEETAPKKEEKTSKAAESKPKESAVSAILKGNTK